MPVPRSACCEVVGGEAAPAGSWAFSANALSAGLLLFTLAVGALDTGLLYSGLAGGILGAMWLQSIVPYAQLLLVIALTRDGGASVASRALRTPLAQWLGRVSMNVYLVHFPLISYLAWAVHGGTNAEPSVLDCTTLAAASRPACEAALAAYDNAKLIPSWGVLVVLPASLFLGWATAHLVEEPGRKLLRAKGESG